MERVAETSPKASPAPAVAPETELAELAAKANGLAYEVHYLSGPGPEGRRLEMTLYRKPPRSRQDFTAEGRPNEVSAKFEGPDGAFQCAKRTEGWRCRRNPRGTTTSLSTDPAQLAIQMRQSLTNLRVSSREIAGTAVRCFSGEPVGPSPAPTASDVETCLSAEGIPLSQRTGPLNLEATRFSAEVDDAAFTLPAAVDDGVPDFGSPGVQVLTQ